MSETIQEQVLRTKVAELENVVLRLTNENKILKEGKTNVFAELNDETAKSNEMLMAKVADLEKKLKTSLDYNKSLLSALKNCGVSRLNSGLIERAECFIKEN